MNRQLRRLTPAGIDAFAQWLDNLRGNPALEPPQRLLDDPTSSQPVLPATAIDERTFPTRFEAAEYLVDRLDAARIANPERDAGLWAWLSLFYIEQLSPKRADGTRKARVPASYIPEVGIARRYYRHLLMGPTMLYLAHRARPECLRALLCNPVYVSTAETYRLFIEHPSFVASPATLAVATALYFDDRTGKLKRGAGSKDAGGCRHLVRFLQQIDCNFDLGALTEHALIAMLPDPFSQFRSTAPLLPPPQPRVGRVVV